MKCPNPHELVGIFFQILNDDPDTDHFASEHLDSCTFCQIRLKRMALMGGNKVPYNCLVMLVLLALIADTGEENIEPDEEPELIMALKHVKECELCAKHFAELKASAARFEKQIEHYRRTQASQATASAQYNPEFDMLQIARKTVNDILSGRPNKRPRRPNPPFSIN